MCFSERRKKMKDKYCGHVVTPRTLNQSLLYCTQTHMDGHKVQQTISVQRRVGTSVHVITMDFLPLDSTGFS